MALKLLSSQDEFTKLPTLAEVSPRYASLIEKQTAVVTARDGLRNEYFALLDKGITGSAYVAKPKTESDEDRAAADRVARILGQASPAPQARTEAAPSTLDVMFRMQSELADFEAALLILGKRLEEERRAASSVILANIEPRHRALADTLLKAMLTLHDANLRYGEFVNGVNENRISWGDTTTIAPWFIGEPTSRDSNLSQYLHEACANGYLPRAKLPAEFE